MNPFLNHSLRRFSGALFLCLGTAFTLEKGIQDEACDSYAGGKVAEIKFSGLKNTQPKVVHRELLNQKGKMFTCEGWRSERKRLESLDIFAHVSLSIKIEEGTLILNYQFEELPFFLPFLSTKKTDQDGFIVGPALASFNLLGQDIRIEGYGRTSVPHLWTANEFRFGLSSYWLGDLPLEYWLQYVYTDSYNPFGFYQENSHYASADLYHRLSPAWSLKYRGEVFGIEARAREEKSLLPGEGLSDFIPRLGLGVLRDTRESRLNPHRGMYSEIQYTQSGGILGGVSGFGEVLLDVFGYLPLAKTVILHYSLLAQQRLGRSVKVYDWFWVGGANSLRGYAPLEDGFAGTSEILSFVEVRHEIADKKPFKIFGNSWYYGLQIVAGADVAYVWNDYDYTGGIDGKALYVGMHILMPALDRIRLELGNKMARLEVNTGFSVGLFERTLLQRWRIR